MSTPHISAEIGEISESILLPGDPLRAKYIAEKYLEDSVLFNAVRNNLGYTGTYRGKKISVMSTGMGIPSASIYITELLKFYGVKNLIRIGTCGSFQKDIKVGDIIMATGACTENGFLRHIFKGDYAPIADFDLLNTAYEISEQKNIKVNVGLIKSGDTFIYGDETFGRTNWAKYGVLCSEMESAALYTWAAKYKARALGLLTVSNSNFETVELTSEERERKLDNMILLSLDTAWEYTK